MDDHMRPFSLLSSLIFSAGLCCLHESAFWVYMGVTALKVYAYASAGNDNDFVLLMWRLCLLEIYQYNMFPSAVYFMFYYVYQYVHEDLDELDEYVEVMLAFSFPVWVMCMIHSNNN